MLQILIRPDYMSKIIVGNLYEWYLKRHGCSEPVKKGVKFIEPIHPGSVKEVEITPGPSNET